MIRLFHNAKVRNIFTFFAFATCLSAYNKLKGCFIFLKQPFVRMKQPFILMKQPPIKMK
ncbi:MAG: hypothetical protein LBL74_01540 [Bacteroidales bacterium]|nr:hypothetical protein [Bacteroidales bacterium]